MPTKSSHHVCPYAAALSDDEDASHEARLRCPAFANGAPCPFRDCPLDDPSSLVEVMRTVPPSHFFSVAPSSSSPSSSSVAPSPVVAGGPGGTKTHFQLAMEHVHRVSERLSSASGRRRRTMPEIFDGSPLAVASKSSSSSSSSNSTSTSSRGGPAADRDRDDDGFVPRDGCPFRSYRRDDDDDENNWADGDGDGDGGGRGASRRLARAMEDFSLAAIMGRMAEERADDGAARPGENGSTAAGGGVGNDDDDDDIGGGETLSRSHDTDASSEPPPRPTSLLSHALKTGTAASHAAAEDVRFVRDFVNGRIDRESYRALVSGLYHAYVALEGLLEEHAPTRFPTLHFPSELARADALREDMDYWHGQDWEGRTSSDLAPSPAVSDYVNRMVEVGRRDPLLLLSHAYTRYLGDLSGGKILSRVARRALNLLDSDGLRFYEFANVPSAKVFKDRYRQALDDLPLSPDDVRRLVAEANVAFALNMRVFEELDVMGGVTGARVRDVREALSYHDIEMDGQDDNLGEGIGGQDGGGGEQEAKCPFGFVGGVGRPGSRREASLGVPDVDKFSTTRSSSSLTRSKANEEALPSEGGTTAGGLRCPWPFIFFHDSATGIKDWKSWFVIGLAMCWFWSRFVDSSTNNDIKEWEQDKNPETFHGGSWDEVEKVLAIL